jgi:hypothetical protein
MPLGAALLAVAVAWPAAPTARADRFVKRALDVDLLDTDCAVVARVRSIEALGSSIERQAPHAVDVERVLWCRWDWAERKPASATSLRPRAAFASSFASCPMDWSPRSTGRRRPGPGLRTRAPT